jgi:ubiquitin C-terminal hydrolase
MLSNSSFQTPNVSSAPSNASIEHAPFGVYVLRAVITHNGGHSYGHFACYCSTDCLTSKGSVECKWWRISDTDVRPLMLDKVLSLQKSAYLLVYEKKDAFRPVYSNSPLDK